MNTTDLQQMIQLLFLSECAREYSYSAGFYFFRKQSKRKKSKKLASFISLTSALWTLDPKALDKAFDKLESTKKRFVLRPISDYIMSLD